MRDNRALHIVGISGSLRATSYNTAVLHAAQELLPAGVKLEVVSLDGIPLYNGDIDGPVQPAAVQALKAAIARADGVLIATPEYNHSISGVLKNALDWVSRPRDSSPLIGMPVAVTGVSGGGFGTVRAQDDLRLILVELMGLTMGKPELFFGPAARQFDGDGNLTDSAKRAEYAQFLNAFVQWIERLRIAERAPA